LNSSRVGIAGCRASCRRKDECISPAMADVPKSAPLKTICEDGCNSRS
jgi:hypothetical protein